MYCIYSLHMYALIYACCVCVCVCVRVCARVITITRTHTQMAIRGRGSSKSEDMKPPHLQEQMHVLVEYEVRA